METPKIHAKHKNAKPYLKNLQATQPLSFEWAKKKFFLIFYSKSYGGKT